jgi:hypothetical protein
MVPDPSGKVPDLKDRVEDALDEARTLILGTQVLLGFQFQMVFEPAFNRMGTWARASSLAGVGLLLGNFALLVLPICYALLIDRGVATQRLVSLATRSVALALPLFAAALALELAISTSPVLGAAAAWVAGLTTAATAVVFWFFIFRRVGGRPVPDNTQEEELPLEDKIKQVLTESRVVLPGAQALLGFAGVTTLLDAFASLPQSGKLAHIAGLLLVALSIILLMTPAAVHRLSEHGGASDAFHRLASVLVLAGLAALGLSLSLEVYVVVLKVSGAALWSLGAALSVLGSLATLWFALPWATGRKRVQ